MTKKLILLSLMFTAPLFAGAEDKEIVKDGWNIGCTAFSSFLSNTQDLSGKMTEETPYIYR